MREKFEIGNSESIEAPISQEPIVSNEEIAKMEVKADAARKTQEQVVDAIDHARQEALSGYEQVEVLPFLGIKQESYMGHKVAEIRYGGLYSNPINGINPRILIFNIIPK